MSVGYTTVKIEPLDCCSDDEEETTEDAVYSKQALDLSIKSARNCDNIQESNTSEVHTEFVNIKTEVDFDES